MATFYLPYFLRDSSGSFVWAGGGSCITSVFFPSRAVGLRSCRFDGGTTSFCDSAGQESRNLGDEQKALCVGEGMARGQAVYTETTTLILSRNSPDI